MENTGLHSHEITKFHNKPTLKAQDLKKKKTMKNLLLKLLIKLILTVKKNSSKLSTEKDCVL